jgi:hypothetical protein
MLIFIGKYEKVEKKKEKKKKKKKKWMSNS